MLTSRRVALLIALAVTALGTVVLFGWALDLSELKSVVSGLPTMKANTAACMLSCGIALALLTVGAPGVPARGGVAVVALVVATVGLLTLGEYLAGWDLHIDQWLFADTPGSVATSSPGRMSAVSALCFVFTGVAFAVSGLVSGSRWRQPVVCALAGATVLIGALALAGYAIEAGFGLRLWNFTGIAVHTAAGFVALGTGLLAWTRSEGGMVWVLDALTTGGFALAALLMLTVAGVSYNYTTRMRQADVALNHTQDVLKQIQTVATDMMDLQAGQRGYILTRNPTLLDRYHQAVAAVRGNLTNLQKLTPDDAHQHAGADEVAPLVVARIDWADQTLAAFERQGLAAAQAMIASRRGSDLSDQIRAVLDTMATDEYALMVVQQGQSSTVSTTTFLLLPLGTLLSLGLLFLGVCLLNRGVAERQSAEARQQASEARLEFALQRSRIGAWELSLTDHTAHRTLIHDRIFGYDTLLPLWTYEMFLEHVLPEDRAEVQRSFGAATAAQADWSFQCRIRRRDGEVRWIWAAGGHQLDAGGRAVRMSGIVQDVTERKRADDELLVLNTELEKRVHERTTQLEQANQELEAFSYSVSHDLRAPLRAMDGFSRAVAEDFGPQLPEEGQRCLATIRNAAQRMGNLIDDLLAFSRLSRSPLNAARVDTEEIVGAVLEDLQAQRGDREIEVRLGDLPPCWGDPALLKQVWINLLSNAFKYTLKRNAAVVETGSTAIDGHHTYFVRDNGTGFDMRYADKLFGVFQRLHRVEEYEGTGVGLAIVQRIVHRHGGRVWAEAAVDRGATFFFTLAEKADHERIQAR